MTGQPYTIKEMKAIVDYLKENKLYGETKGRKMWMDYASSQLTTRTWQSLKETFLKRVLPDLHNPYYNLTIEQINSFRSGYDIKERNKTKLEIHTVSDDSDGVQNDLPQTSNGNDKEQENKSGETIKCSKIALRSRSSADTVIVDTCYETAEDIQKELEAPIGQKENGETKSLRDCIQYTEPLTPVVQEVLDDFQSEPENELETSDRENQLQIVDHTDIENLENISNEVSKIVNQNHSNKAVFVDVANDSSEKNTGLIASDNGKVDKNLDLSQIKAMPDSQSKGDENTTSHPEIDTKGESEALILSGHESDQAEKNRDSNVIEESTKKSKELVEKEQIKVIAPVTSSGVLNNSTTPDASLPNNPEALKKRVSNEEKTEPSENKDRKIRKRLNSESALKVGDSKNSKLDPKKNKANSENESKKVDKTVSNVKSKSVEPISKPRENDKTKSKKIATVKLEGVLEKPSTSKNNHLEKKLGSETDEKSIKTETRNPCLNNLSLFSYNSSGTSDIDENKKKDSEIDKAKNKTEEKNEIVKINSLTDSDIEEVNTPPKKKHRPGVNVKLEKERGLANVFGFSSGAAHLKRKRRLSRRRRTLSQTLSSQNNGGSNSSEWTSESDSEPYVSPPRGRKNRPSKKYRKPQSARIQSLEEEGGLFVMYGKKIYPLIKDGKLLKHYLSYQPDSESDEENYWKLKYVEEKKKSAELKKLLQESKAPKASTSKRLSSRRDSTPTIDCDPPQDTSKNDGLICLPSRDEKKEAPKVNLPGNIKIKFTTKNDQEIHLEGNWNQLQNALDHVVHIFHKEPEPISKPKALIREPSSSRIASPIDVLSIESAVDPETHEKVDKIEDKIFKEIEEMDKKQRLPSEELNNVTKRRGRRSTVSSSASDITSKRKKTSDQQETTDPVQETLETDQIPVIQKKSPAKTTPIENNDNEIPMKKLRAQRNISNESSNAKEMESTRTTRKSTLKLGTSNVTESVEDQEIRYMLPPQNKKRNSKPTEKKSKTGLKRSMPDIMKIYTASEIASQNFLESTQDYQDSDESPMPELRKKKRLKISAMKTKYLSHLRRSTRNKPSPFIYYDDSSVSSTEISQRKVTSNNSTNNTEVYRSESYQLLVHPVKQPVIAIQRLSSIDENPVTHIDHLESIEECELKQSHNNKDLFNCEPDQINGDVGSSSQISLPLSPELSVVENLSISQDLIDTIKDQPTENETIQFNKNINTGTCNHFLTSDVLPDSPMQLGYTQNGQLLNTNESNCQTTHVTDSLLNKVKAFKIDDKNNLTDTLDDKLRDLLLESAKKIATENVQHRPSNMDIDVSYKIKQRKRCSTPRKRTGSQKSKKALKIQNVIEEEHIHNCSQGGRKSCPPVIETVPIIVYDELNISNLTIEGNVNSKGRKKKDVIKVKITKPKSRKIRHNIIEHTNDIIKDSVTKSILCNDSGINNTESGDLLAVDDTVDLIHNHSDTCLQTNECIGESVEFVDNSLKSILTLSDSQSHDSTWRNQDNFNDDVDSADFFSNDTQDVRSCYKSKQDALLNISETEYHSPLGTGASSLITEDLSDDVSPPITRFEKWYLLSEDETTNFNIPNEHRIANTSFGSNLKQIFPISCAVPDLSTITEMSKDNEDSNQRSTVEDIIINE